MNVASMPLPYRRAFASRPYNGRLVNRRGKCRSARDPRDRPAARLSRQTVRRALRSDELAGQGGSRRVAGLCGIEHSPACQAGAGKVGRGAAAPVGQGSRQRGSRGLWVSSVGEEPSPGVTPCTRLGSGMSRPVGTVTTWGSALGLLRPLIPASEGGSTYGEGSPYSSSRRRRSLIGTSGSSVLAR